MQNQSLIETCTTAGWGRRARLFVGLLCLVRWIDSSFLSKVRSHFGSRIAGSPACRGSSGLLEASCQICRAPMLPRALARSSARSAARMWTGALTARSIGFNSPEHRLSCWCPPQVPQVGKVVGGGRGHDSGKQLCFFWNRGSTLNCVFGNGCCTFDSRVGTQVLH